MNVYKLILVVLLGISSFVGLANLATIWHGALFIMLVPVWAWAAWWWYEWAGK